MSKKTTEEGTSKRKHKDRRRFDSESFYKEFVQTGETYKVYFQLLKYRRRYSVDIRLKFLDDRNGNTKWNWSKTKAIRIDLPLAKKLPNILRELADVTEEYYKEFVKDED